MKLLMLSSIVAGSLITVALGSIFAARSYGANLSYLGFSKNNRSKNLAIHHRRRRPARSQKRTISNKRKSAAWIRSHRPKSRIVSIRSRKVA